MLLVQVALDGIEDAIDELRCFVGGKAAGDLKRFVDGDGAGRRESRQPAPPGMQRIACSDSRRGRRHKVQEKVTDSWTTFAELAMVAFGGNGKRDSA